MFSSVIGYVRMCILDCMDVRELRVRFIVLLTLHAPC